MDDLGIEPLGGLRLVAMVDLHPHIGPRQAVDRLFNWEPYLLGGDSTTVWTTGDLLAPSQSGQLAIRHHNNQMHTWFTGEYHSVLYAREDVEREVEAKLQLLLIIDA